MVNTTDNCSYGADILVSKIGNNQTANDTFSRETQRGCECIRGPGRPFPSELWGEIVLRKEPAMYREGPSRRRQQLVQRPRGCSKILLIGD